MANRLSIWILLVLFSLISAAIPKAEEQSERLTNVASYALKSGKNASLNAWFAGVLGISKAKESIPLKRLVKKSESATNIFNISLQDRQTIILSVREGNVGTFYLTDFSGKLRKAVVNDSSIRNGGMTNIPVAKAQANFLKAKRFWIQQAAEAYR